MAEIQQQITPYDGTVPDHDTQTREEFNDAVDEYLDWWTVPVDEINQFGSEANDLRNEVNTFRSDAETYKNDAATSASNASDSADAAATSESNAADSESNAATSESNAASSASDADTYKTDAYNWAEREEDSSYTDADGNEGYSALHHRNKAEAAQSAAETAESNAATSESNAATSESNAQDSANDAEGFRDQARDARDSAENAEAATLAAANFEGKWSELSGSLGPPASVLHNDKYWTLLDYLEDVTSEEPSESNSYWEELPYLEEAPSDGNEYVRKDGDWVELPSDITDMSSYDTDDLSEGTSNLYHTDQRAADAAPVQEAPEDGARYTRKDGSWSQLPSDITDMSNYDTDDLSEGTSNQYFTTSRIDDHLSGGTGISYSTGTIGNTDTGSDAVGTHESDYDHDDFCTGGYDIQKDGSDGNGVINFKTS